VSLDILTLEEKELRARLLRAEERVRVLQALLRLVMALLRVSGFSLGERLPSGEAKSRILRGIERATTGLPLRKALAVVGISAERYRAWKQRALVCALDDRSSCPRLSPSSLRADEIATIREMVTAMAFRHFSMASLALYAQRTRKVFASATTWCRLARERGWRRPRSRVYPAKPKVGLRAVAPNQYWHVDVTIVKLLDGTKAFVHAVIDSFSRKVVAHAVVDHLILETTTTVLRSARTLLKTDPGDHSPPIVISDSGIENIGPVSALAEEGWLKHLVAQVDIVSSNSMVERYFMSLRHQWLYLHDLTDLKTVTRLVDQYVSDHNTLIPHAALGGRTPDEVYFGTRCELPAWLEFARASAREDRRQANLAAACGPCPWAENVNASRHVDRSNGPP
jgi:transposase InsO family protein